MRSPTWDGPDGGNLEKVPSRGGLWHDEVSAYKYLSASFSQLHRPMKALQMGKGSQRATGDASRGSMEGHETLPRKSDMPRGHG